jgi:hypothetical protein
MKKRIDLFFLVVVTLFFGNLSFAQSGQVRGYVYDQASGQPVGFATVYLGGTQLGTTTDIEGFYTISGISEGSYSLIASFVGYDSIAVDIAVGNNGVLNQNIYIKESNVELQGVEISAEKTVRKEQVNVSVTKVTPKEIKVLPSVGGQPDLAQYLQVLPGVIFTGDQGGQLYIRGGSPVQNKVLIDGMTIYNPFHSIGFFSVFETEAIRNVDVLTGGFGAKYGGRISAVVDIQTREGNRKRFGGIVSANPFQTKALVEGPIIRLKDDNEGTSVSFLLTGKHSYIDRTSPKLYSYADSSGLPYNFTDLYGKISLNSSNGSKVNVFGFNYRDNVSYTGLSELGWTSTGGGMNFKLLPSNAKMVIGGRFAYSNYDISLAESDAQPRTSSVGGFNGGIDFSLFGKNSETNYGIEIVGLATDFRFKNYTGVNIEQTQNTTELAGFVSHRQKLGALVLEPSLRLHYYASLSNLSLEPRLGLKLNVTDDIRVKFAGGMYSQNLISAVNERDIVNLFVGFLSGPEEAVYNPQTGADTEHRLQKAIHAIGGVEFDITDNLQFNVEPYFKRFTQLINLNRNKITNQDPSYVAETGNAYGVDFSADYKKDRLFVWAVYSMAYVNRNNGEQTYPTNFDRRHNANLVTGYTMGKDKSWDASVRWNLGSGFPFTLTQGFFESVTPTGGIDSDFITQNGDLGIEYDQIINGGRLPYYHRLDISLTKKIKFSKYAGMEINASATNVYNRQNIFYFDRVRYTRVNQLPILPSLGVTFNF